MTDTDILTESIIEEDEKNFLRLFNKGLGFQASKQYEQAINYYVKAVSIKPDHLPLQQILGYLYQSTQHFPEALHHYQCAIALHPHSATLQNSAGICEERCNNLPAAKTYYLTAAELKQDNAEALNNVGNIYRKQGEYSKAEEYLLTALRLQISIETLANLGVLMDELGKYNLALSFYEHALRLQPDNPQLKWNKGLVLLSQGDFDQGWFLYDHGFFAKTRPKQKVLHIEHRSHYSVDFFRNKSVFIKGEQGLGDEIMFASCIPDIINVAKKCTIECDNRLVELFRRSFPEANVLSDIDSLLQGTNKPEAENIIISMASLPRFIRRDFIDFPRRSAYLFAFPKAVKKWKNRYATNDISDKKSNKLSNKKLNIGISWKGGIQDQKRRRSTDLATWSNILNAPQINCINLQYGDISQEQTFVNNHLIDWPDTDHFHNIEQLAAQIVGLDLVITVSNATAHLAGALGVPVFVLLPKSPNWRWFMGKNPCPWYKSATLFTQKETNNWQPVLVAVEKALMEFIETRRDSKKQSSLTN